MVKINNKNPEKEKKLSSTTTKKKKYPTCALCGKDFIDCIIVGNYHPECFEIKKEKEVSPYLFSKVEQLEKEIMAMKSNGK